MMRLVIPVLRAMVTGAVGTLVHVATIALLLIRSHLDSIESPPLLVLVLGEFIHFSLIVLSVDATISWYASKRRRLSICAVYGISAGVSGVVSIAWARAGILDDGIWPFVQTLVLCSFDGCIAIGLATPRLLSQYTKARPSRLAGLLLAGVWGAAGLVLSEYGALAMRQLWNSGEGSSFSHFIEPPLAAGYVLGLAFFLLGGIPREVGDSVGPNSLPVSSNPQ